MLFSVNCGWQLGAGGGEIGALEILGCVGWIFAWLGLAVEKNDGTGQMVGLNEGGGFEDCRIESLGFWAASWYGDGFYLGGVNISWDTANWLACQGLGDAEGVGW